MYQILFKIPITNEENQEANNTNQPNQPNPIEILEHLSIVDNRIGQFHISNSEFIAFGFNQETDDISKFNSCLQKYSNIEILVQEIIESPLI
jgi:hypothetical protein